MSLNEREDGTVYLGYGRPMRPGVPVGDRLPDSLYRPPFPMERRRPPLRQEPKQPVRRPGGGSCAGREPTVVLSGRR